MRVDGISTLLESERWYEDDSDRNFSVPFVGESLRFVPALLCLVRRPVIDVIGRMRYPESLLSSPSFVNIASVRLSRWHNN